MATTVNPKTFPGVYTSITDDSFIPTAISRFRPGLVGVATKGPFDTATAVRSLKEFRRIFGRPLTTVYSAAYTPSSAGFFLADAVGLISDLSDGAVVVRVGNRYQDLSVADGSGAIGAYTFGTTQAPLLDPSAHGGSNVYVRLSQSGTISTVGARVLSTTGSTVTLSTTTDPLAATYSGATIGFSLQENAANEAEGTLLAYTYADDWSGTVDSPVSGVGSIAGTKNAYQFTVSYAGSNIDVGGVYKIAETSKRTTHEVRVKSKLGNTVYLETSDITRVGYQALPLQDSYEAGIIYKATGTIPFMRLEAASPGTWANGGSPTTGLFVKVRPGSSAGTKKLEVYEDGALVETFDNLSEDSASDDYYTTRINGADGLGISQYIRVSTVYDAGGGQTYHPANTASPWDSAYYGQAPSASPKSMPNGRVNAGYSYDSGGMFVGGYNGENAQDTDFVGTYDTVGDQLTGFKVFEDTDNISVNVLAAPMDLGQMTAYGRTVIQEMARVARKINAMAVATIPPNLNSWQAIDWHNGAGQYSGAGRVDTPNLALFWNWFKYVDAFTGIEKYVPTELAVLRAMAFTFDREAPWKAAAGEQRGVIQEALEVQYDTVLDDAKQAMYGSGNSVNPLLRVRGRHVVFGDRTMQVAESKLSAIHNQILVNYVVNGLAEIGRKYVFEPNDPELLSQIRLAFSEFLDKVKNERGLEDYELVVDDRNNNADTRNQRQVIVDLAIIPTDVAERIFLNASVKSSGATLNTVAA